MRTERARFYLTLTKEKTMSERYINGVNIEDLNCEMCGENIENNGGYLHLSHGILVCSGSEKNIDCWWEFIDQYSSEVYDLDSVEEEELDE
jgi:hypothetical protein|tara:strand:- start:275 stop:547 length:273 start_codon:yes stop_codon:yes gene_type:complete